MHSILPIDDWSWDYMTDGLGASFYKISQQLLTLKSVTAWWVQMFTHIMFLFLGSVEMYKYCGI